MASANEAQSPEVLVVEPLQGSPTDLDNDNNSNISENVDLVVCEPISIVNEEKEEVIDEKSDNILEKIDDNKFDVNENYMEIDQKTDIGSSSASLPTKTVYEKFCRRKSRRNSGKISTNFSLWVGVTSCVWGILLYIIKSYT